MEAAALQDGNLRRKAKGLAAHDDNFLTSLTSQLRVSCAASLVVADAESVPASLELSIKHLYHLSCTCKSLVSTCKAVAMMVFGSKPQSVRTRWPHKAGESWLRALWRRSMEWSFTKR